MQLDLNIENNVASYIDPDTGFSIFIDSFDNRTFNVRVGSVEQSKAVGSVVAETSEELNKKVAALVEGYQKSK